MFTCPDAIKNELKVVLHERSAFMPPYGFHSSESCGINKYGNICLKEHIYKI
jgi:hypothetical protein